MLRPLIVTPVLAVVLALFASGAAADGLFGKDDSKEKQRAEIRDDSHDVLARLYAARPEARRAISGAAGYATFQNKGLKLGVVGGGRGRGLAVNNDTGRETFMKFLEAQAGVGIGVKKYDLVFVFETSQALGNFLSKGWQYGGQATLAAKNKGKGKAYQGAVSVAPGVWLYQITESGLAAEITAKGTKYSVDDDLN